MRCPRYKASLLTQSNGFERIREGDAECDQQECGQWDEKHDQCCVKTMAQREVSISGVVSTHPA